MQSNPYRVSFLILALLGVSAYTFLREEDPWVNKARVETPKRMADLRQVPNQVAGWPPEIGKPFPPVGLVDHEGKTVSVESWKGHVTLVEIVAMTCAACQGFSGGDTLGGFGGMPAQSGLQSIEKYYREYTPGLELFSGEINFIQLVIYNLRLDAPRPEELAAWRTHFRFDKHPSVQVVTGGEALANKASYHMVPGFLLLDRNLVVRFDATGHNPKHGLFTELLPAVRNILGEK